MTIFRPLLSLIAFFGLIAYSHAQVVINETDADDSGGDDEEFIELYDGGVGNTSLNGMIVVLFNGSDDQSYGEAIDLNGFSTNVNGFFVIGSPGMPSADIELDPGGSGWLQNGADAVALMMDSAANFPNDTPVTAVNLIDAVVYGTNDSTDTELINALLPGGVQLDEGTLGDKDTDSIGRSPDGGAALNSLLWTTFDIPTPGGPNVPSEEITAFFDVASISENGGTATLSILLDSAVAADTNIILELAGRDTSELSVSSPAVVLAGNDSLDVTVTAIDDAWRDFDQTVTVNVSDATNQFSPSSPSITITDDETGDPTGLRVNEVYPAIGFGTDANQDGLDGGANGSDEFVELVNDSATALDISGYTVHDSFIQLHTFPAGTVLDPGCAVVVFGAGAVEGMPASFGGATVQNANAGTPFGLELNNDGDIISIRNTSGVEVAGHQWVDAISADGSFTLDPDLNVTNTFTVHNVLGGPFSPGFTTTGSPFCIADTFSVSVSPASVLENAGASASTMTISRSGDLTVALTVTLTSSDTTEATLPATAMFPAGVDEIDVPVDVLDDSAADGTISVTLTVSAAGFVDGNTVLDVVDDGDAAPTVFINEVDYDQPGSDDAEFVEIYDGGAGNTPLDGFVLVAYNGNGGTESATFDLGGTQTNGAGFYAHFVAANSFQNGPDEAIALWTGAAAADFDGTTADFPPAGAMLIDVIVYETGANATIHTAFNYTGPDLADSNSDPLSLSRSPDGSGAFALLAPSPNASNGTVATSAYDTWAASFPGIGARTDDDDCDGIPNLLEFALGTDPSAPNPLPSPIINGSDNLQLTVPKGSDAGNDANTSYFIEASIDGITWNGTDVTIISDTSASIVAEYTGASTVALLRIGVTVAP